jgi:hypothetical protein
MLVGPLRQLLLVELATGDAEGMRRNTAFITLKTAVLAPMPTARVATTVRANPGDF